MTPSPPESSPTVPMATIEIPTATPSQETTAIAQSTPTFPPYTSFPPATVTSEPSVGVPPTVEPPTGEPPTGSPPADHPSLEALERFIDSINSKNWKTAYQMGSEGGLKRTSFSQFETNWLNNEHVTIEKHLVISSDAYKVRMYIMLLSTDRNKQTGAMETDKYDGVVTLVLQSGEWKIDDPMMLTVKKVR